MQCTPAKNTFGIAHDNLIHIKALSPTPNPFNTRILSINRMHNHTTVESINAIQFAIMTS